MAEEPHRRPPSARELTGMRRLHLLVEGQTEEIITERIIRPHLEGIGWTVSTSVLVTKRPASGGHFHGGVSKWSSIEKEIRLLLASQFDVVTTLIDYYAFPHNAPGMSSRPRNDPYAAIAHVEEALRAAISHSTFLPHLVLHETEAWVFAAAAHLAAITDDSKLASDLQTMVHQAGGPELINDGAATAPSKRLTQRFPSYQKTLHGPLAIEALGLKDLADQCPHLAAWLEKLT